MNYDELVETIQTTTENYESTFVAEIPNFVRNAEEKIINSVALPAARASDDLTLTISSPYVTLPSDFLAPYTASVVTPVTLAQTPLVNKDVSYIREAYPTPSSTGTPKYYALDNDTRLILGPTPDVAYTVALIYYAYPASIVDAGTSWLGSNFHSVLLYGSLIEAHIFMKGETDIGAMYQLNFEQSLMRLQRLVDGMDRRDNFRTPPPRILPRRNAYTAGQVPPNTVL
jgi:hypothetical protein